MGKCLFFRGPARIGKSTVLRDKLNGEGLSICGFTVQRVRENEEIVGYQITLIDRTELPAVETETRERLTGMLISNRVFDIDPLIFTVKELGERLKNGGHDVVLLDEIGGRELENKEFMLKLMSILKQEIPCIGILKSKDNLMNSKINSRLGGLALAEYCNLERYILENGSICDVLPDNVVEIQEQLDCFISEAIM